MSNPVLKDCPADVWTKVVTNVLSGTVKIIDVSPTVYYETYRVTGDPAPSVIDPNNITFDGYNFDRLLGISDSAGIDVYIMPISAAGKVRVDS